MEAEFLASAAGMLDLHVTVAVYKRSTLYAVSLDTLYGIVHL